MTTGARLSDISGEEPQPWLGVAHATPSSIALPDVPQLDLIYLGNMI